MEAELLVQRYRGAELPEKVRMMMDQTESGSETAASSSLTSGDSDPWHGGRGYLCR